MKKKIGMKDEEYKDLLAEANPEMIFFDGFEDALIGFSTRFGMEPVALYDRNKCIKILIDRDKMTLEEAEEFFEFNTAGAWVGDATPAFAVIIPRNGQS